jgi:hypothetical protein
MTEEELRALAKMLGIEGGEDFTPQPLDVEAIRKLLEKLKLPPEHQGIVDVLLGLFEVLPLGYVNLLIPALLDAIAPKVPKSSLDILRERVEEIRIEQAELELQESLDPDAVARRERAAELGIEAAELDITALTQRMADSVNANTIAAARLKWEQDEAVLDRDINKKQFDITMAIARGELAEARAFRIQQKELEIRKQDLQARSQNLSFIATIAGDPNLLASFMQSPQGNEMLANLGIENLIGRTIPEGVEKFFPGGLAGGQKAIPPTITEEVVSPGTESQVIFEEVEVRAQLPPGGEATRMSQLLAEVEAEFQGEDIELLLEMEGDDGTRFRQAVQEEAKRRLDDELRTTRQQVKQVIPGTSEVRRTGGTPGQPARLGVPTSFRPPSRQDLSALSSADLQALFLTGARKGLTPFDIGQKVERLAPPTPRPRVRRR